MWSALAIIRNPGVFGQNADVFEPRRWLEAEPSELRQMETAYGLVFVTGMRWKCWVSRHGVSTGLQQAGGSTKITPE